MGTVQHPLVYEIHTAAFLHRLSKAHDRHITLGSVPASEWDRLAQLGVQTVWLMGVWQRSPAGARLSMANKTFLPELREAVPGLHARDVIGSAYCIKEYVVDDMFGGPEGLAKTRKQLADRGIGLMLDFVPNHTAPDHPWISKHPDFYIRGETHDFKKDPASFLHIGHTVYARGRDPHYAAWPDVVQLNAFSEGYRQAAINTLRSIADQADAVRCDMAMLMCSNIFAKTWGERAGTAPTVEFWEEVIAAVKKTHPDFTFLAEAYWDTEAELLRQGFGYCYDKTLYDLLLEGSSRGIRHYIGKLDEAQIHFCRFSENHDEQRAAAALPLDQSRVAAAAIMTLPGMKLLHDGQMEGMRVKIPVHVNHGPTEKPNQELQSFYEQLLAATASLRTKNLRWHLWHVDNPQLLVWEWRNDHRRYVVVINYAGNPTHFTLHLDKAELLTEELSKQPINTDEPGRFSVQLQPWDIKLFSN